MTNITAVLILTAIMICVALSGCASSGGLKVSYDVHKEEFGGLHPMQIRVVDARADKEIVGPGAKPTIGKHAIGYIFFGPAYIPFHVLNRNGPQVHEEADLPETVRRAFVERFAANDVAITDGAPILLEIELNKFLLDFSLGTWTAEAGYLATITENGSVLCTQAVEEKRTRFNLNGYASGEAALSDVFNAAVNAFTPKACTRKST